MWVGDSDAFLHLRLFPGRLMRLHWSCDVRVAHYSSTASDLFQLWLSLTKLFTHMVINSTVRSAWIQGQARARSSSALMWGFQYQPVCVYVCVCVCVHIQWLWGQVLPWNILTVIMENTLCHNPSYPRWNSPLLVRHYGPKDAPEWPGITSFKRIALLGILAKAETDTRKQKPQKGQMMSPLVLPMQMMDNGTITTAL